MATFFKKLTKLFLWLALIITMSGFFCIASINYYASSKPTGKTLQAPPQKILIITGELSGERLALWYLDKLKKQYSNLIIHALGRDLLPKQKDIQMHPEFDGLRTGFFLSSNESILHHITQLPQLYNLFQKLVTFVLTNNFDHVILIDAHLISIPLARTLKQKKPSIHLTYIAPPAMWLWGAWGVDRLLKNNLDQIITLYPFEKEWFRSIGIDVEWFGYPFYHELVSENNLEQKKEKCIALIPGSRKAELEVMLPVLNEFVQQISKRHPEILFVLPLAESFTYDFMQQMLDKYQLSKKVKIVSGDQAKKDALSRCFLAITKPGTMTLQLALLKTPMIITYKVPYLNYLIFKMLIQAKFVGLPNLCASCEICKELLQDDCSPEMLVAEAELIYQAFLTNDKSYQEKLNALENLKQLFNSNWQHNQTSGRESTPYAPQYT